jgi:8-oxo-dGTP diphosphatase
MAKIPYELHRKIHKMVPVLCIDGVIFKNEAVLLIKRSIPPFKNHWTLPGGHVMYGETVEQAVLREIKEETGLSIKIEKLVGIYSDPKRDPRGHLITIAYLLKPIKGRIKPDKREANDIRFFKKLPEKIGFDHRKIIRDAINTLKNKNCLKIQANKSL